MSALGFAFIVVCIHSAFKKHKNAVTNAYGAQVEVDDLLHKNSSLFLTGSEK
jgi:hypothetical protein